MYVGLAQQNAGNRTEQEIAVDRKDKNKQQKEEKKTCKDDKQYKNASC
jgi:hypothetical protein